MLLSGDVRLPLKASLKSALGVFSFSLVCFYSVLVLSAAAQYDHHNSDCFACVVLSHGESGYVYATDEIIPLSSIFEPFREKNCPGLQGKPKLFFIQVIVPMLERAPCVYPVGGANLPIIGLCLRKICHRASYECTPNSQKTVQGGR